jgi:hypothetical protein
MVFDGLIQQVLERVQQATAARAAADQARRQERETNDHYVTGGVHWDGFSLEHLIKMVAERASPQQLNALADEWRNQGTAINQASTDLQRSLNTLMQYWSGSAADQSAQTVTGNAAWIAELGNTAQNMAAPIEHAGGALKSAQDTMPGKPHSNWLATAGGGAAAGFAVGGPIGAAFGAAIGGIASAFGFGSNKKKLKRQAVQTMQRYETALLGIDGTTPQFGSPSNGTNPGIDPIRSSPPGVGTPGSPTNPPGGATPPLNPGNGITPPSTIPSLAEGGPGARWQGLTGLGPAAGGPGGFGGTGPGLRPGFGGFPPGLFPGGRGGLPPGGGRVPPGTGTGRGGTGTGRGGAGRGAYGPGGLGGRGGPGDREYKGRGVRGAGGGRGGVFGLEEEQARRARGTGRGGAFGAEDEEARRARGRGGAIGAEEEGRGRGRGAGAGAALGEEEEAARRRNAAGARGRFGRGGLDPHGSGYPMGGGAGAREEEDEEHRRKFPVEEDPFSDDLKAAPPVIGI